MLKINSSLLKSKKKKILRKFMQTKNLLPFKTIFPKKNLIFFMSK